MKKLGTALLLGMVLTGCSSGPKPAPAPAGPADLSSLSPQEQIKKIQDDPSMPDSVKSTAITSIKQKNGIP